jgi:hypothetical protein
MLSISSSLIAHTGTCKHDALGGHARGKMSVAIAEHNFVWI